VAFAHGDDGYGGPVGNPRTASAERSAAKPALADRSLRTRKRSRLARDLVEDLAIDERGRVAPRAIDCARSCASLAAARNRRRSPHRRRSPRDPLAVDRSLTVDRPRSIDEAREPPPSALRRAEIACGAIDRRKRARGRSQGLCELCANWEARGIGRAQPLH